MKPASLSLAAEDGSSPDSESFRRFSAQVPHSAALGIEFVTMDGESVTLSMQPGAAMLGDPHRDLLFTSVVYSLVDSACGLAVFNVVRSAKPIATLDLRIDYLQACARSAGTLYCWATCKRATADVAFVEAEVSQDEHRRLAVARGVFALSSPGEAETIAHNQVAA